MTDDERIFAERMAGAFSGGAWTDTEADKDADAGQPDHPLAAFIEFDPVPRAPHWLIPNFVPAGASTFAGEPSIGKTSALVALALIAAGLCPADHPLRPPHWRRVVYLCESVHQVQSLLFAQSKFAGWGTTEEIRDRIKLVRARRMDATAIAPVGAWYRQNLTRHVEGVELVPIVVFDTTSATIQLESENASSEVSDAIARLRQRFADLHVWLVTHVAKTTQQGTAGTPRGSGAWAGDVESTFAMIEAADGERHIVAGKRRFESPVTALHIVSQTCPVQAVGEFGQMCELSLRWCDLQPADTPIKRAPAKRVSEIAGAITEFLRTKGTGVRRKALIEHFASRYDKSSIYRELKRMVEAGILIEAAGIIAASQQVRTDAN